VTALKNCDREKFKNQGMLQQQQKKIAFSLKGGEAPGQRPGFFCRTTKKSQNPEKILIFSGFCGLRLPKNAKAFLH